MLDNFPSLLRLLLCVFFSAGLHGSAVYYDWMTSPAEARLVNAPVVVSFLPETDVASFVMSESLQPRPNVTSATAKPHVDDAEQPVLQPVKKVTSPPGSATAEKKPKPSAPVVIKEPKEEAPSAEMVCMAPQDAVYENLSESLADSPSEFASDEMDAKSEQTPNRVQLAQLQSAENALLDTVPTSAYQSLVEAVPNYRSNPLPEYPYVARQKHWEGVVWLLVDVSAEGLVDDLRVEQSCGHRVLDRTASRTVRRWQFSPAKRAGLAVSSQVRIPVRFHLEDD